MRLTRKNIIISVVILCLLIAAIKIIRSYIADGRRSFYTVTRGNFEEVITCKGEINSVNPVEINMPLYLQNAYNLLRMSSSFKILRIVDEGTYVKKGDFIIQLDPSQIMSTMRNNSMELEKMVSDLNNIKIDSTVRLTQLREEILDAELDLEYNKIDLDMSVYESEAYQRQTKMNYEKAVIAIEKKKRDYLLERNKIKVGIQRTEANVEERKNLIARYKVAMDSCTITSPGQGIVMIAKSPLEGKKYKRDDYIYSFMPLIAILPNMNTVNSEVYIREIDIAKIAVGDSARITFDALDGITLKGKVAWINTFGEDRKEYDMKVFKVFIWLAETDPGLKPAMSSNNDIIINNLKGVLSVPDKAVFSKEGETFVYLKKGGRVTKQEVKTGPNSKGFTVITGGLKEGDKILISEPEKPKKKEANQQNQTKTT
jgi:HlyD family secretion protein